MNLPNLLSVIRLCMIPITAILFSEDRVLAATLVFVLACLTDILDGVIARKFNLITNLGKILDPLADKGMQITMLVSMAIVGLMPWIVVIVLFVKELMMCVGGAVLYKAKTVIGANSYGKISTVVTSSCVVLILLFHEIFPQAAIFALQWLPLLFALYAFIKYSQVFAEIKKQNNMEQ